MEQTYFDISAGNKIGVHKFLKALELLDNEVMPINMDNNDNSKSDINKEDKAHQCFILLRLFTMCLPNLSKQVKNELFVVFSRSNLFGVLEHNALLDALAHLVKGLNLFDYDELG
ncbi:1909_t:CDS:2, partial [Racocetra fulgida]